MTYDDGPSDRLTVQLIQLLDHYNAKATFFILGSKIQQAGEIVNSVVQAGHEIGSHSYWHLNAWKRSPLAVYRDIKLGFVVLRRVGCCALFRPPHGKSTLATMVQATMNNCTLAWWTIDSSDSWDTPMPVERVVERIRRDGGGVILMHDHHEGTNATELDEYVFTLTEKILELARTEGYMITPMRKLYSV